MGFSVSWIAVQGKDVAHVLQTAKLRKTGKIGDMYDHRISGAALPSGWFLIYFDREFETPYSKGDTLAKLSADAQVLTCCIEEHCMFSAASSWSNGKRDWWVEHNSERGIKDLQTGGTLPPEYLGIRDHLMAQQDLPQDEPLCDFIFDVPIELTRAFTGFRHDQDAVGFRDDAFEELE
jgi:hypothetical protein